MPEARFPLVGINWEYDTTAAELSILDRNDPDFDPDDWPGEGGPMDYDAALFIGSGMIIEGDLADIHAFGRRIMELAGRMARTSRKREHQW